MKKRVAFLLALVLLLTSCGGGSGASAATMHLRRTEGTVGVADGEGKTIEPKENLGLYSGYGVDTRAESYAWIDLDKVKLAKLDQDSEIEITKDGKKLEIEVKSGAMFFNVMEPLADDETMNIRTSTMMVGIRGTCGWVALSEDKSVLTVGLLEGKVECSNGESTAAVSAGEKGAIPASGEITVGPLAAAQVPAFVKAELEEDSALAETVKAASGIDVLAPIDPMCLRDMYTYSRSLNYNAAGELLIEQTFFPDEQGRIGKMVVQDGSETVYEYIYTDEGSLSQRVGADGTVVAAVTEDTPDHRIIINPERANATYTYYYDEQGRTVSAEYIGENNHSASYTYIYDAEGKLSRTDCYDPSGQLTSYSLYEYD